MNDLNDETFGAFDDAVGPAPVGELVPTQTEKLRPQADRTQVATLTSLVRRRATSDTSRCSRPSRPPHASRPRGVPSTRTPCCPDLRRTRVPARLRTRPSISLSMLPRRRVRTAPSTTSRQSSGPRLAPTRRAHRPLPLPDDRSRSRKSRQRCSVARWRRYRSSNCLRPASPRPPRPSPPSWPLPSRASSSCSSSSNSRLTTSPRSGSRSRNTSNSSVPGPSVLDRRRSHRV